MLRLLLLLSIFSLLAFSQARSDPYREKRAIGDIIEDVKGKANEIFGEATTTPSDRSIFDWLSDAKDKVKEVGKDAVGKAKDVFSLVQEEEMNGKPIPREKRFLGSHVRNRDRVFEMTGSWELSEERRRKRDTRLEDEVMIEKNEKGILARSWDWVKSTWDMITPW